MFLFDIYCFMGYYYTFCHNTYVFSLLFYKVCMKMENAGSWNSGLEKEQILKILHNSRSPETPRKLVLEYIKNIGQRKHQRGAPHYPRGRGRALPLGRPPASWAPWQASGAHLLLYEVFRPGKNRKEAFGTKRRRLEAEPGETNLGLRRSCFAGETSLREGEIITIDPLIGRGLHQHLHQHHLISNPSSSLVSNLYLKTSD